MSKSPNSFKEITSLSLPKFREDGEITWWKWEDQLKAQLVLRGLAHLIFTDVGVFKYTKSKPPPLDPLSDVPAYNTRLRTAGTEVEGEGGEGGSTSGEGGGGRSTPGMEEVLLAAIEKGSQQAGEVAGLVVFKIIQALEASKQEDEARRKAEKVFTAPKLLWSLLAESTEGDANIIVISHADTQDGVAAFKELKERFGQVDVLHTVTLQEELYQLCQDFKASTPPDRLMHEMERINRVLSEYGNEYKVTDHSLRSALHRAITRVGVYKTWLDSDRGKVLTMDWKDMRKQLVAHFTHSVKQELKSVNYTNVKCHRCNGIGHYANDPRCPMYGKPDPGNDGGGGSGGGGKKAKDKSKYCSYHKMCDHTTEECTKWKPGMGKGNGNKRGKGKFAGALKGGDVPFDRGREEINDLPLPKRSLPRRKGKRAPRHRLKYRLRPTPTVFPTDNAPYLPGLEHLYYVNLVNNNPRHTLDPIIDSGATASCVCNGKLLINRRPANAHVQVGDGSIIEAIGAGDLPVQVWDNVGQLVKFVIPNVLIVPDLEYIVLSTSKIISDLKGDVCHTHDDGSYLQVNGHIIPLTYTAGLYHLPMRSRGYTVPKVMVTTHEARLWHKRLGHRHSSALGQLASMPGTGVPSGLCLDEACEVCILGKQTRKPHKPCSSRTTVPFEEFHTDLYSATVESQDGDYHAVVFTDVATRWRKIYFMTLKSEFAAIFRKFLDDVKSNHAGKVVRRLHSDRGREFFNDAVKAICVKEGIELTASAPYTPEENGIAERTWRTLENMATCMLLDAKCGRDLWAEAMHHATYLLNRLPTSALDGSTPYYAVYHKHANLSKLPVWGCCAYVLNLTHLKFEAKSIPGIFCGMDSRHPGMYRVYVPTGTGKMHITGEVRFDEPTMFTARHADKYTPVGPAGVDLVEMSESDLFSDDDGDDDDTDKREFASERNDDTTSSLASRRSINGGESKAINGGESKADDTTDSSDAFNFLPSRTRSGRQVKPSYLAREHNIIVHAINTACEIRTDRSEPKTYKQAVTGIEGEKWKGAMDIEIEGLRVQDTYELVVPPPGAKILKNMWVYKYKRDATGAIVRHKARLVVKGFAQEAGIDYTETYAPVAMSKTVRMVLSIAAMEGWIVENMDVNNAFVQSSLGDTVYMQQPEGYKVTNGSGQPLVWKLKKSLYGLKQSPRNWNLVIDKWLKDYGLVQSDADPCLYVKTTGIDKLVIVLYVDDLLIAGNNGDMIKKFKTDIADYFDMKDLGEIKWMLGMEVRRNLEEKTIELVQTAYIDQVLERENMINCKSVSTPMVADLDRNVSKIGGFNFKYARVVGSLMYLAIISRPDIAYAVQSLARHMQAPTDEHIKAAEHLLRYVQGTKQLGLLLGGKGSNIELVGYSDSNWAADKDTRRSTTGYVFTIGCGASSWSSRLQPTVALSTAEAEYMALSCAVQEAVYLRRLLKSLGYEQQQPTPIFEDNQACIAMTANPVLHQRTKHIDIRYHFTRERVISGDVDIQYVATNYQLADILTKPLLRLKLERFRGPILGYSVLQ